jgi:RimJ/RimL family protein N-acetyltransferase
MLPVTTSRLILRELTPGDAPHFYTLNSDPEVIRYTWDHPFENVSAAETFLAGYTHYQQYGFGRWAIIRQQDGQFLGWCGLNYTPATDEYDIGFRLFRKYWGQGYATEAAKASIDLGFNTFLIPAIIGRSMKVNTASIRVLEKAGLTFYRTAILHGDEGVIHRIEKPKND